MNQVNIVMNPDYWDGVSISRDFNRICYGFHTEEQFYAFTEPIEDLRKDMKFLDFGCGPGRIVKTVASNVKEYVGVDVSAGLLEMAKEHHKQYENVSFFKGNGTDLKIFEDNTFDYIYERLVFIHVPKEWIVGYMAEFLRILKVDGILCIPDFPRIEGNTNGFTMAEMNEMLENFKHIDIDTTGTTYKVRCVKR